MTLAFLTGQSHGHIMWGAPWGLICKLSPCPHAQLTQGHQDPQALPGPTPGLCPPASRLCLCLSLQLLVTRPPSAFCSLFCQLLLKYLAQWQINICCTELICVWFCIAPEMDPWVTTPTQQTATPCLAP